MIAQSCISQTDTTNYPKVLYPQEITKDTIIAFTPNQVKQIAIDAINADSYKEQLDSSKHIINEHQEFINLKNKEISNKDFIITQYDLMLTGYKAIDTLQQDEIKQQNLTIEKLEKKDWWSRLERKIVYPVLVGLIITTVTGFLTK